MQPILLAPHSDDEALFAAIICMRWKPLVVVVTDSFIQYERGQLEITSHRRRDETRAACAVLGVDCCFLGIADDVIERFTPFDLRRLLPAADLAFVPAHQGGHAQHDLVAEAAAYRQVVRYSTYAKHEALTPARGYIELAPTLDEVLLKQKALACYQSQAWQSHFAAVTDAGYQEWISGWP